MEWDNTYILIYFFSVGIKHFSMKKNRNVYKSESVMYNEKKLKGILSLCIHIFNPFLPQYWELLARHSLFVASSK